MTFLATWMPFATHLAFHYTIYIFNYIYIYMLYIYIHTRLWLLSSSGQRDPRFCGVFLGMP